VDVYKIYYTFRGNGFSFGILCVSMSVASIASGSYTDCGYGQGFALKVSCDGPSCGPIASFPGLTCTHKASLIECDNGVSCDIVSAQALYATQVTSNFTLNQQNAQTSDVQTNQNLNVNGQQFNVTDTGQGNVSYTYNNQLVTPSTTSSVSHSRAPRFSFPKWLLILAFVLGVQAQSPWATLLTGFPSEIVSLVESMGNQLCQGMVPILNSVINQGLQDYRGVADLNLACAQILGQANPDPSTALFFNLGTTLACDKISNDMLYGSSAQVGRAVCQATVVSSGTSTSLAIVSTATSSIALPSPAVVTTMAPTSSSPSATPSSPASTGNATIDVAERWKRHLPVHYLEL
jgi:hypothetical protein